MIESHSQMGGFRTITVGDAKAPLVVVMLHGRMMEGADLAPFARSLGTQAYFVFPDAPLRTGAHGFAWWPVESETRLRGRGVRDLYELDPPGRSEARERLKRLLELFRGRRLVLVGFSQGGMLAMDYVLHGGRVDALALLSSSRIAYADWKPRLSRLLALPMLVAHGRADPELAFSAGEALRDAAFAGGAQLTWLPFEGGHEIPLVVWRALRKFLAAV
jgi:phospholipase/carboxylesterase